MYVRFSLVALVATVCPADALERSFVVRNDTFFKDGQPFNLRSGSLHYFRVPQAYWRDRMQRMKALGLNSVTMYVPWNYHETVEGKIQKIEDVRNFVNVANEEGMLVIFRPGPYICGEWEFGGLPAWLLFSDKKGIRLRTFEQQYISAVDRWMSALYTVVNDRIYSRGGPIIIVQIENEYGSFGDCSKNANDAKYMNHLLNLANRFFSTHVVYSTIDGGEGKTSARLDAGSPWRGDRRVLATVDGGLSDSATYATAFARQKDFNAAGNSPKMWSELWVGWFTVWRDQHAANLSATHVSAGMSAMTFQNASFSLYMAHGGTNFGFWSGANGDSKSYKPDITSYDYSSPISEAADHNIGSDGKDLFVAVQSAIALNYGAPTAVEPKAIPKSSYGRIELTDRAAMFDNLEHLSSCKQPVPNGHALPSFEELRFNYGFVLYTHKGSFDSATVTFTPEATHDRAQMFVDGKEVGTAYRPLCPSRLVIPGGSDAKLLVENMGRINYGNGMYDYKGFLGAPPVAGNWSAHCLPLGPEVVSRLPFTSHWGEGPMFLRGTFQVDDDPTDTWLDTFGFSKGYIWANGYNLGRFWETEGPQHTLYLPAPFLRKGDNEIIVLDLHSSSHTPKSIMSVARPRYKSQDQSSKVFKGEETIWL